MKSSKEYYDSAKSSKKYVWFFGFVLLCHIVSYIMDRYYWEIPSDSETVIYMLIALCVMTGNYRGELFAGDVAKELEDLREKIDSMNEKDS